MRSPGIRWQLTLWYGLVLAAVLTLFSGTVYWTMRHQLLGRIDQGLREELSDVRSEVERADNASALLEWLQRRFAHHEGFDFQITRSNGDPFFLNNRLVGRGLPLPRRMAEATDLVFESVALTDAGSWRIVCVRVSGPEERLTVQVARSLTAFEQESRELLRVFLLAGSLTLLGTLAGGYFLARRTLAPVQQMSETARQISAERLGRRLLLIAAQRRLSYSTGRMRYGDIILHSS